MREVKDVPTNMTTLGGYIRISPRCMKAFKVRPAFGSNVKKAEGNDYLDMVYFAVAISCDVAPSELISRISVEWLCFGTVLPIPDAAPIPGAVPSTYISTLSRTGAVLP